MKWLLVLAIVLPLAQQPTEAPKYKGTAETNRTKGTDQPKNTERNQTQPAQATPASPQMPVATESQRHAATADDHARTISQQTANEDRSTQRKLAWFTGVLAVVGGLQLVVMFLTWLIYRRQAYEMRRQRHEMRRQRHVMLNQWKAMRAQLGQTEEANRINREGIQAGQRAYVSFAVLDIQYGKNVDANGNVQWWFRDAIENTGNTPAWKLIDRTNAVWPEAELPDDFAFPDLGDERLYVSTLSAKSRIYSAKLAIADSVIRSVYEGRLRLYFYGWATYRDVFDGTPLRRTEFCHEWRILEIAGDRLTLDISLHSRHNTQT